MIAYFSYYLILSVAVGVFQIIEGIKLVRKEGKVDENDLAMSVIEFIWFLVSCGFVVYLPKEFVLLILPVLFIIYNISGWALSYFTTPKIEKPEDLKNITIPLWVCISGAVFGAIFAGMSGYLYVNLMLEYVI